jgi:hypothetical protein
MGSGVFAEASPCCPSPVFGQLIIIAYIVGGAIVYTWMFSALLRWAYGRYRRRT